MSSIKNLTIIIFAGLFTMACSREVGSEKWCTQLEATPKGDWTANMAADYAKHCILKMENDEN